MSKVTAAELKLAIDSLLAPDSVDDSIYTVFLTNPDRALMFTKVIRGDGWDEPWRNEWVVTNPPLSPVVPADPIMSDAEFDASVDAMQDAEQQIMLNVANSLLDDMEPDTLQTVANWCDERAAKLEADVERRADEALAIEDGEVPNWVDPAFGAMFKPVSKRGGRPGGRTSDAADNYTPSLEELQDAADARGEPGPLEKPVQVEAVKEYSPHDPNMYEEVLTTVLRPCGSTRPVDVADAVSLVHRFVDEFDWIDASSLLGVVQSKFDKLDAEADLFEAALPVDGIQEAPEEAPEFDLFDAAKDIREAAYAYNFLVIKAREEGNVVVTATVPVSDHPTSTSGTVWIDTIKLEMKL